MNTNGHQANAPPLTTHNSPLTHASERYVSSRHHLALIYRELRRPYDAESQWRAALAEQPDYQPALLGLRDLYRQLGRIQEVELLDEQLGSPELADSPA